MFRSWMIIVKSRNADRMMNHKFVKEYKMISKSRKNFGKNKRIINIRDDFFFKSVVYQLSRQKTITIWNFAHLNFWNFQYSIFILSIKFTEFFVVRFNTFLFTSIKLIKSFIARFYALVETMKSVKYSNVLELKLIKD